MEDGHDHHEDLIMDVSDPSTWNEEISVEKTFTEESQGLYFLMYQRCSPETDDKHHKVSFLLHHHFANFSPSGKEAHLSVGEQPLPTVYFAFSILYGAAAVAWITVVRKAKKTEVGGGSNGRGVASRAVREIKVRERVWSEVVDSSMAANRKPLTHECHPLLSLCFSSPPRSTTSTT